MDVRVCTSAAEMSAAFAPIWHYFGRLPPTEDQIRHFARVMEPHRVHAGFDNDNVVSGCASFPFDLTVPGGQVRAAGVTVVGVLPTHRRRGYLNAMMRALIDAAHARAEPVAVLWATEDTIYGRFGYGMASMTAEIDLPREHAALVAPPGLVAQTRLVPLEAAEPLIAPIYDRVARATPGMFARTPAWWQDRVLTDPDWRRGNGGFLRCAVLEIGGRPSAYAFYRVNQMFERGNSSGNVFVVEAMGDSAEATQAIWQFLFGIDWLARLKAIFLPLDHPLLLSLRAPRRLNFLVREGLWVRLIDLPAALAARGYATDGAVVIEVADTFCPRNAGRWRIGRDGIVRTQEPADLACDVNALGSVYLGGFTFAELARALRVEELREGALARADALFHSDRKPWCPELF
jgi:predicted acetyltransferase